MGADSDFFRGQSSVELVVLIVIELFILFAFIIGTSAYENSILANRQAMEARALLWKVAAEINGAASIGRGYERQFALPDTLPSGVNYTLGITPKDQTIEITWGSTGAEYWLPIITSNITGSFAKGTNYIRNVNGLVVISQT